MLILPVKSGEAVLKAAFGSAQTVFSKSLVTINQLAEVPKSPSPILSEMDADSRESASEGVSPVHVFNARFR